jgi:hypothetical protein
MSLEMVVVGLCLAAAFGAVPFALLLHIHVLTWRSVRHVEAIEALAKSRTVDQLPAPPVERPARPQLYLVQTARMHVNREPACRAVRPCGLAPTPQRLLVVVRQRGDRASRHFHPL